MQTHGANEGATILVVDDYPTSRKLLVALLEYEGYTLIESANGSGALELAQQRHPDLVITDVNMPVMGGVELANRLRQHPATERTPILFYTASIAEGALAKLAQAVGRENVLTKPCSPEVILAAVSSALGQPRLE